MNKDWFIDLSLTGDVLKIEILFHIFLLQHFTVRTEEIELASVGDGNLNDVIRVKNASKSVILKSAPPYIKVDTCFCNVTHKVLLLEIPLAFYSLKQEPNGFRSN